MADKTTDMRFIKTRNSITEAMIDLLRHKNFEQITVKDICTQANVSRSGFYLHYEDKYDLVKKYQLALTHEGNTLVKTKLRQNRRKLLHDLIHMLTTDGQLLALLLSKNGSTAIQEQVKSVMRENAQQNILPYMNINVTNTLEAKYLVVFLSNAIFGVVQEWINSGQNESPDEMITVINQLLAKLM